MSQPPPIPNVQANKPPARMFRLLGIGATLSLVIAAAVTAIPIFALPQPSAPTTRYTLPVTIKQQDPGGFEITETQHTLQAQAFHAAVEPHRILEAKITDTRDRRQVEIAIALTEIPDREAVRQLLREIEAECETLYEFRYFTHIYGATQPTHIWIDIYATEAHFETKNGFTRLARLSRFPKDFGDRRSFSSSVSIEDAYLADLTSPGEERFGYTREERMAIYSAIGDAVARANQIADQSHPVPEFDGNNSEEFSTQFDRNYELRTALQVQAREEIAHEHILSMRALYEIMDEGMQKGWPQR